MYHIVFLSPAGDGRFFCCPRLTHQIKAGAEKHIGTSSNKIIKGNFFIKKS